MTLLSRDTELARLTTALAAAEAGATAIVLIEGAAGCGKSETLRTVADTARERGATVLWAAATPEGPATGQRALDEWAEALRTPGADSAPFTATAFTAAVRGLDGPAPLVICLDDLQYADAASLACLTGATRAPRGTGLLLVLTGPLGGPGADARDAVTELLRHPGFDRIRLGRLDRAATAALLRDRLRGAARGESADRLYARTGGNPLLLKALLSEYDTARPEPAGPFADAVRACLQRCGRPARDLARALAVLGTHATLQRAAAIAGAAPADAARALAALDETGLTDGPELRHPDIAAAALDTLGAAERTRLYGRTAEVLYADRAEAETVASYLRVHGSAPGDWAVRTLCEAGQQALAADEAERAAACLQLAHAGTDDEPTRWRIGLQLAALTWRLTPAAAEQHLDAPLAALRAGRPGAPTGSLARLLVAQGRAAEAAEVLRLAPSGAGALRDLFAVPPASESDETLLCAALWTHPGDPRGASTAERLLEGTPLAHDTFEPLVQAVRILLHTGHPRRAAARCGELHADAEHRRARGWQAMFASLRGEALVHLGDLAGAERAASAAVAAVAGRGGTFMYRPVAVLVTALTAMGRYDDAARHLPLPLPDQLPDQLPGTVHALPYLRARGRYYLATHRAQAALSEFLDVGRLAERWGLDHCGGLPWRIDAADALLRLRRPGEARVLTTAQLAVPGIGPRTRGMALRLHAATEETHGRPALLTRAIADLRGCGDRLELAKAVADFGRSLQTLGEGPRAGSVIRRAWRLADECDATPLCEEILPDRPRGDAGAEVRRCAPTAADPDVDLLSQSERRVAALASAGYTNREIGAKLFVTTSTVEQHLTRIYRKLNISRRQDLPIDLQLDILEHVGVQ
ncbi:helix-turn-helix transcriptional regulator [Streptomyces sp. CB02460]|uniref:helix-turn-helix transcriptional regulator n=1 Tax=Streptomyces sp. CB02460 TaxID=1703941 RepID=UPI0009A0CC71|nr:LuxR family transcriptional regulator [Streptomyces sp. CB02460]